MGAKTKSGASTLLQKCFDTSYRSYFNNLLRLYFGIDLIFGKKCAYQSWWESKTSFFFLHVSTSFSSFSRVRFFIVFFVKMLLNNVKMSHGRLFFDMVLPSGIICGLDK